MPNHNARLTMRLTPVTSNQEPELYLSLVIEDAISGLRVAAFDLLPQDVMDLMSQRQVGGVDGVKAWLLEPEMRDALGMKQFTTNYNFPASQYNDDTVERWARRISGALGAASYSVSMSNDRQLRVRFTYYTNALPASVEREREQRQAAMDVAATACAADR